MKIPVAGSIKKTTLELNTLENIYRKNDSSAPIQLYTRYVFEVYDWAQVIFRPIALR